MMKMDVISSCIMKIINQSEQKFHGGKFLKIGIVLIIIEVIIVVLAIDMANDVTENAIGIVSGANIPVLTTLFYLFMTSSFAHSRLERFSAKTRSRGSFVLGLCVLLSIPLAFTWPSFIFPALVTAGTQHFGVVAEAEVADSHYVHFTGKGDSHMYISEDASSAEALQVEIVYANHSQLILVFPGKTQQYSMIQEKSRSGETFEVKYLPLAPALFRIQ